MGSLTSGDRRGEEGKKVGEPRGEVERRGEEPRGEEPGRSPLSGTSSAFLLRPGAGLVALALGGAAGSKVLPKLPGAGGASQVTLLGCSVGGARVWEGHDDLTHGELKADWLVPDLPVDHGGLEQRCEEQETLRSVRVELEEKDIMGFNPNEPCLNSLCALTATTITLGSHLKTQ